MKLDSYITPLTKIFSKWTNDLNVSPEITKLLEENTGGKLLDICLGSDFLAMTKKQKQQKQR